MKQLDPAKNEFSQMEKFRFLVSGHENNRLVSNSCLLNDPRTNESKHTFSLREYKSRKKEYIRCAFLLGCGIIVESRSIQKDYSLVVPEHFCEPCAGHLHRHIPLSPSSSARHRCGRLRNETLPILEALNRFYRMAEKEINHSHDVMLQNHHPLRNDHPITITDLEDNRKIKRMISYESLNDQDKEFLIPYAEVTMLAAYLQLASDIYQDVYRKRHRHPLEEPLEKAIDNLRTASCRHNSLVQNLNLTSLSKKFCQYGKLIQLNSKTNATKYVLSIFKHAKKNMAYILDELDSLKAKANSCDLFRKPNDSESTDTSSAGVERKKSRNSKRQDDENASNNSSRVDKRTVRSSLTHRQNNKEASKAKSNNDKTISKRQRRKGKKNRRRHRKRNRKMKRRDKGSKRKNRKRRKNKRRRNRGKKSKSL